MLTAAFFPNHPAPQNQRKPVCNPHTASPCDAGVISYDCLIAWALAHGFAPGACYSLLCPGGGRAHVCIPRVSQRTFPTHPAPLNRRWR